MSDFVAALKSLRPGAKWSFNGDTLAPTKGHPDWGLAWNDDVQARPTDANIEAEAERIALAAVRRVIPKAIVLERLTDAQLEQSLSLMTPRQKERWRMPGKPDIYVDDPELLGMLKAIGADAAIVLAP
jgi:hypothetical protein